MLNKLLYGALERLFKHVEIVNEDVHAYIEPDKSGSGQWTMPQGEDRGEQYKVDCPYCGDHRGHLYISYLSYAVPVINGNVMRMGPLMSHCFRRDCMSDPDNKRHLEGRIGLAMTLVGDGMQSSFPIDMSDVGQQEDGTEFNLSSSVTLDGLRTWIPDWQPVDGNTDQAIVDYLCERRVTKADVDWLGIGWGPVKSPRSGNYLTGGKPWVLFPIVNNGKLCGVQARCPPAYMTDESFKYWFHPGCRKRTLLLNLDAARSCGVGVLCEGAFDVLSIGKPGLCCFGHTPSVFQRRVLSCFDHGIIWLPDTDTRADLDCISIARTQAAQWNEAGLFDKGAHVVTLPAKDAGDMTRQEVWTEIIKQVSQPMREYLFERVIPKL